MSKNLSQFIGEDLRANPPLPSAPLTLAALATRYQVSLTPVRQAVQELVASGVLEKSATGRLRYRTNPPLLPTQMPLALSLSRDWEDELRRSILQRSLRGDQEFLREEALSEQLAIGRTVLRQALHHLAGQGFVEHVPRCGWRARELTLTEVDDWLRVRERLELLPWSSPGPT